MKVFISWSGTPSRQVAEFFKEWLKCVLQATEPWVSTEDIESGSVWFTEINEQLANCTVGIVCLTKENKDNPWILFESGALLKGLSKNRVCPFLIDLNTVDVIPPLSLLNLTIPERASVFKLVKIINKSLASPLPTDVLATVFDTYWPQFEKKINDIRSAIPSTPPVARDPQDVLSELLSTVRSFDRRLANMEIDKNNIDISFEETNRTLSRDEARHLYRLSQQEPGLFNYSKEVKANGLSKTKAFAILTQHNENYNADTVSRMLDLVYRSQF